MNREIINKFFATISMATLLLMPLASASANATIQNSSTTQTSVSMYDNYFAPSPITVSAGTTVTWTNRGSMQHTVTSDNGLFSSGAINPGSSFSITFNSPGTYRYYCQFHGGPGGQGMS